MPRVSVIVPAFNAARTIAETLRSVQAQTAADIEVLVVDDGSTDGTAEVADGFAPLVRCIRQANGGVSAARNAAIDQSDGELVAFLDADDVWEPTKLERQLEVFDADPGIGVTYTGAVKVDADSRPLGPMPVAQHADPCREMLLRSSIMALSAGVVRRAALGDLRFDRRFSQCADWDLWLRLALRTRFGAIPEPLLRYRSSPGNMSADVSMLERDTFGVLDAFYERPEAAPYRTIRRRAYANHWMIVSGSYLHTGHPLASVRCLGRGLLAHPGAAARPLGLPLRRLRPSRP